MDTSKAGQLIAEQMEALDRDYGDAYGTSSKRVAYPFARSDNGFPKSIDRAMPGVRQARSDVADAIRLHQPYQPGHDWLKWLNGLRTRSTHASLTPLVPEVGLADGAQFSTATPEEAGRDATAAPSAEIEDVSAEGAAFQQVVYLAWRFTTPPRPVLDTLREIQAGVRAAVEDVCQVAGL
jgi:hypothetical protein